MKKLVAAIAALCLTLLPTPATANHEVYLPYAGQTWLAQRIKANQEQVWCADARASAYPGFLSQLRNVNDEYTARVGIKHRGVAFSDPACEIKHLMADVFPCGDGAAACINYGNSPVTVYYKYQLGYVDWRSAQGHELGHGMLGLHEQYRDSGGNIGCTGRQDTVMDCGGSPPVRYPQTLDVGRGCAIILASWCGRQPAPKAEEYTNCTTYAGWEPTVSCYWPKYDAWLWTIPLNGRDSLWEWSTTRPKWTCTVGCP